MKTKSIESLGKAVLLAFLLCIPILFLQSCSDDNDNDKKQSEFEKVLTRGAWAQNGDNDIFIFCSDGTWYTYECPEDFDNKDERGFAGTWSYNNNVFSMTELYEYDGDEKIPLEDDDQKWTDMYTLTTYSSDFVSLKQIYPEDEKDRVWNLTRYQ